MFAENIVQAMLEQVKTTRGKSLQSNQSFDSVLTLSRLDTILVHDNITGIATEKLRFTTRYVAGTNFLGKAQWSVKEKQQISIGYIS